MAIDESLQANAVQKNDGWPLLCFNRISRGRFPFFCCLLDVFTLLNEGARVFRRELTLVANHLSQSLFVDFLLLAGP